ncbi:MAG: flagellar type III secretion system protein FliQ [Phycisphaerae bacterium]|nr:flagellar type III secretion system protein FliQ [Phycisphaerae bacterium]
MDATEAMELVRGAIMLLLVVSLPVLLTILVIGLIVSVMQAVTQVADPTLSFVPKILAVLLVAIVAGPWMVSMIVDFSRSMFTLP